MSDHERSLEVEWKHVQEAVGLLELPSLSLIQMTGADCVRFLQGMTSNDVASLEEGRGTFAFFLTSQGRIVSDARIYRTQEGFLIETFASFQAPLLQHIEKYLVADEVELKPLPEVDFVALQGPLVSPALQDLGLAMPEKPYSHLLLEAPIAENRVPIRIVRVKLTQAPGFVIQIPKNGAGPARKWLLEGVRKHGGGMVGPETLQTLRVEAGIPWCGFDFDNRNLPLETGLDCFVSETKGCYLGQEAMEKIRARGHLNKHLAILRIDGSILPAPGARILAGERDVGELRSGAISVLLRCPLAFGTIQRDFCTLDTRVAILDVQGSLPATIFGMPAPGL
jgi:folate-binding protein YgfZ